MDQTVEISSSFITCLLNLRRTNRGLFCLVMSTSFLMIGFLGSTISGSLIVYLSLMTCALAPGLVLHVLPSGFVPMIKSFFPVNPCDDGTDVFAEDLGLKTEVSRSEVSRSDVPKAGVPVSQPLDGNKVPSSTFPLPMLFDLISNPSSDDSNESEATFLEQKFPEIQSGSTGEIPEIQSGSTGKIPDTQSESTGEIPDTSESTSSYLTQLSAADAFDFPEECFIRRAISSAISFATPGSSPPLTGGHQSPKDGDRSPASNASGRSSDGIKIVTSHYESSGGGTPSESEDNLLDESYEIVTDNEINQLDRQ